MSSKILCWFVVYFYVVHGRSKCELNCLLCLIVINHLSSNSRIMGPDWLEVHQDGF